MRDCCPAGGSSEPRATIGPTGPCPPQASLGMQHLAQEQGWVGDDNLGEPRALQIPGKAAVVGRTEVWPGSHPKVGMRDESW